MRDPGLESPDGALRGSAEATLRALLDEQALEMLGRAVAQTPLPESLRGRHFTVTLPIRFSLEE